MSLTIDVVIPVHGNLAMTQSCLRHLQAQTIPSRIIVYDDVSPDDTAERLARDWPQVTIVSRPPQAGFAAAVNRGAAAGDGDVIVVLNNDVEVGEEFLARLVAPLRKRPELGSVAAVMLWPGGRLLDSVGLTCDRTLAAFPRLRGETVARAADTRPTLVGPAGTAAAYRRAAWERLGGLDETITGYMEDFDLALRLAATGWETAAAADARGVHLGSATYGHRSALQRSHGGFARGYLLGRYGILRGPAAPRTIVSEALVIGADALLNRDLAALRGRLDGLRVAARQPHRSPPWTTVDTTIGFRRSLALRRQVYGGAAHTG